MAVPWNGRDEVEKLAKRIVYLEDQVKALAAAPTTVPNVDVAPAATFVGNVWMLSDGRLQVRRRDGTVREIAMTAAGSTTSGTTQTPVPPQLTTRQTTWAAAWSQTYRGNGAQRSETTLHVGSSGDSFNGVQTALIGWPYATIATALSGAVIQAVEVFLYTTHCYWNNGSDVFFASQFNTAAPGTLSGINTGVLSSAHVRGSDQGGSGQWCRVDNNFGAFLRDGTSRGMALVPPSANLSYYAILGGVGSGVPAPSIRITYLK
jgi:hypothetical protein